MLFFLRHAPVPENFLKSVNFFRVVSYNLLKILMIF